MCVYIYIYIYITTNITYMLYSGIRKWPLMKWWFSSGSKVHTSNYFKQFNTCHPDILQTYTAIERQNPISTNDCIHVYLIACIISSLYHYYYHYYYLFCFMKPLLERPATAGRGIVQSLYDPPYIHIYIYIYVYIYIYICIYIYIYRERI